MFFRYCFALLLLAFLLLSCTQPEGGTLFTEVPRSRTGIDFRNLIVEKETFNIFKYQYFYNGGGVAVGDFNNDGLQDLVFTGNMVKNRLYLNRGGFEFQDVTKESGIADQEGWCTGATPVDINGDGWLDLYICRAGYPFENLRRNLLYINMGAVSPPSGGGGVRFQEKAAEYGLDDPAHATHSAFFDYDNDGDLDLFLLNHSTVEYSRGSLDVTQLRKQTHPEFTNKLFRNDGGRFTNVTAQAGITSNVLTFSLGISVADINLDGWADIFIGNDFNEPDYLFVNQRDGTFKDMAAECFDHTSMFSMGSDVADYDNDGLPDLVSLDMLPESNFLQKMHSGADNFDKVNLLIQSGFYRQYSRNTLQHNNGDGTFSEIGQLAGVSNTDWSWSPLFFDFENDGDKDLFIANGYLRDHTDMDFLAFTADEVTKIKNSQQHVGFQEYLTKMPPIIQPNYFFENGGNGFQFQNRTHDLGYAKPTVTQGAAYADLDNDGDLDLVLNNSNDYATVLENHAEKTFPQNRWLRVALRGTPQNPTGIGAKVYVWVNGQSQYQEQNPVRGFQAAVDPVLSFGFGTAAQADSVVVVWSTGERQVLTQIAAHQTIEVKIQDARSRHTYATAAVQPFFSELKNALPLSARHMENHFNDFKTQGLLPYFYSRPGPALAAADVNGDGLTDFYLGGAAGHAGQLFLAQKTGGWGAVRTPAFETDAACEDVSACFFDADGDGDADLYVSGGGYELATGDANGRDRMYRNVGDGKFAADPSLRSDPTPDPGRWRDNFGTYPQPPFPLWGVSGGGVAPADFNADGDLDLFICGTVKPGRFPESTDSRLLLNDGTGRFTTVSVPTKSPVKAALWADLNGDHQPELVVASEWAGLQVFENQNGILEDRSATYFSGNTSGLWQSIAAADFDGDGDMDLMAGNLGLNSQLQASEQLPLELYSADFDRNGSVDPILCYPVQGMLYPFASREDVLGQLPMLKKKFVHFRDYANATVREMFSPEDLAAASRLEVAVLESSFFENKNGRFERRALPLAAQVAPVCALHLMDVNSDQHLDAVLAGNITQARVKLGRLDGLHGLVLLGDGRGHFNPMPAAQCGLQVHGAVRGICGAKTARGQALIFGVNDEAVRAYLCN